MKKKINKYIEKEKIIHNILNIKFYVFFKKF